ncbi:hypothetical protein [Kangiella sp.]|uniref:hypothetical protein n=1 Tax=Kangiella sp. TaxID=1920245 RepID=UPI003A9265F6
MKVLFTLLIILIIGSSYGLTQNNMQNNIASPFMLQADEPGTGNDGEDTAERGMMCRLFGVFCKTN